MSSDFIRVLILSDRYLPDLTGTALRVAQLVHPLVQGQACEIHVATLMQHLAPRVSQQTILSGYEVLDGVHVHRFASERLLALALFQLQHRYRFDVLHARGVRYGFYARLASLVSGVPSILELNSINPQTNFIKSLAFRYAIRSSSRLIVLANHARQWAAQHYGVPPDQIDVVVNGVDPNRFQNQADASFIRQQLGLQGAVVVGYAGTFLEWQGVFEFVRAAAHVLAQQPNVRFLMVGDGPDFGQTRDLAEKLGIADRFIFTGLVHSEDVPAYMRAMDVFLLARPVHHLKNQLAMPLKLLEAMAVGSTVVVTPVHGLTEVVHHGENGLVVSDSTPTSIAQTVVELVVNQQLRARLALAARREVEEKYTWDAAARNLLSSYQYACAGNSHAKTH